MLHMHQYNIIILSKTWLKDNKNILNYIQTPSYILSYRNKNEIRVAGLYIKDSIEYMTSQLQSD